MTAGREKNFDVVVYSAESSILFCYLDDAEYGIIRKRLRDNQMITVRRFNDEKLKKKDMAWP